MELPRARPVLLTPERFADLTAGTPLAIWRQRLVEAGLADIEADGSEEGRLIARIQALTLTQPEGERPLRPAELLLIFVFAVAGMALATLIMRSMAGGTICFAFVSLGPLQALWRWRRRRQAGPEPGEALRAAVDALLARNFIAGMGNSLVESVPMRAWLQERIQAVSRAIQEAEARMQRLGGMRDRMRDLNRQMQQPEEDAETEAILQTIAHLRDGAVRVRQLQIGLSGKLAELDQRLQERRLRTERRMLSARLDQLQDGEQRRLSAPLSADMGALEEELARLDIQIREEQAKLEAGLEVRRLLPG